LHAQVLGGYGIEVQAVEIEPAVVELAGEFFGLAAPVTVADGRVFLARTPLRFDAIILDAFVGATPAEHLHTREAFARMAACLEPGGLVAVHVIASPQHPATQAVARTLEAVFPHVAAVHSGLGEELQNIYLFASGEPLELLPEKRLHLESFGFTGQEFYTVNTGLALLLTDDRTTLALLARNLAAEHRRSSRQMEGRLSPGVTNLLQENRQGRVILFPGG
jgi:hypothetical protein